MQAGRASHDLHGSLASCCAHWPVHLCAPLPAENGEAIQILKYVDGQKYEPHTDYFHDK